MMNEGILEAAAYKNATTAVLWLPSLSLSPQAYSENLKSADDVSVLLTQAMTLLECAEIASYFRNYDIDGHSSAIFAW